MSDPREPTKDNAHVRADPDAFMAAYVRARETLRRIPGVAGVGFGHKQVGGRFSDDVGITVYVGEKRPESELAPEQRIPRSFEGYRTDVREVRRGTPLRCDDRQHYSPIRGGIQIQAQGTAMTPEDESAGTLGCIVRRRGDPGRENVHILSNAHVLFANQAHAGNYVYHPFVERQHPVSHGESLGTIQDPHVQKMVNRVLPGETDPTGFYLDCAFALVHIDCKCWITTCTHDDIKYRTEILGLQVNGADTLADVRSVARDSAIVTPAGPPTATSPRVFKSGRTTGRTVGIVRNVNAQMTVLRNPGDPHPVFDVADNVIEIEFDASSEPTGLNCKGRASFAEKGDSGSIVVDDQRRAIGLLYAIDTDQHGTILAYASHIVPVLDALGICIPTDGGTSHGSCAATDGSGLTTVRHAAAVDVESPTGAFHFTHATTPRRPAALPLAEFDDARLAELLARRDALLETALGRTLYHTFGVVRRELGYLARNCRPVKVAWHRTQGPAFLAHVLNHLRGDVDAVPHEIAGVTRETMLLRMGDVLRAHGSIPLREAIATHAAVLLDVLRDADTMDDALARLRRWEKSRGAADEVLV